MLYGAVFIKDGLSGKITKRECFFKMLLHRNLVKIWDVAHFLERN